MKELIPGLENATRRKYKREPEHKCPFCQTRLNKEKLLLGWRHIKEFFLNNRDAIARKVIFREIYSHPDIEINPDLLYALRCDAGCEGLELSDLVNQILDGYYAGKLNRVMRRRRRKRLLDQKPRAKNADNECGQLSAPKRHV